MDLNMDKVLYQGGNGIRVVERKSKLYLRYDIGTHCTIFREDEITQEEFAIILKDKDNRFQKDTVQVLYGIADRLKSQGIDPHKSNYSLSQYNEEEKS